MSLIWGVVKKRQSHSSFCSMAVNPPRSMVFWISSQVWKGICSFPLGNLTVLIGATPLR